MIERWKEVTGGRSFWMEVEVSSLMGAEDEVIWNSVRLFTSDEELRSLAGWRNVKVNVSYFNAVTQVGTGYSPVTQHPLDLSPDSGGMQFLQESLSHFPVGS
jgi:hypothetical protein